MESEGQFMVSTWKHAPPDLSTPGCLRFGAASRSCLGFVRFLISRNVNEARFRVTHLREGIACLNSWGERSSIAPDDLISTPTTGERDAIPPKVVSICVHPLVRH